MIMMKIILSLCQNFHVYVFEMYVKSLNKNFIFKFLFIQNYETIIYNCLSLSFSSDPSKSNEYLSTTNVIYLELIPPSILINDYDDDNNPHQFKLFFTFFARKTNSRLCPYKYLIDCNDSYCVHENSRCNGLDECRTKLDEKFCTNEKSTGLSYLFIIDDSIIYFVLILFYALTHGQSLF